MSINLRNLARGTVTRIRSRVEQEDFGGDSAEIEQLTASLERAFERFVQEHYGLVAAAADDKELVSFAPPLSTFRRETLIKMVSKSHKPLSTTWPGRKESYPTQQLIYKALIFL